MKTGSVNDLLTPDRNLKITGHEIKLAGDSEDVGVYFVNQTSGDSTKVDSSEIVVNNPSGIIIVTPELEAVTYQLKVITRYTVGSTLKSTRTLSFDKILTVS